MSESNKIIKGVADYYTERIRKFGNTSQGVDWNSKESQYIRFQELSKIIDTENPFTLTDYGCGTGELINYLSQNFKAFNYLGYDVSEDMINEAVKKFSEHPEVNFTNKKPVTQSDYLIASGIFNVKLDLATEEKWLHYILETLHNMNSLCIKGFSFNALTRYSDAEYMKDYLFYSDPLFLFDFCKNNFSKNIALLHDYTLYEFTIIVRK